MGNLPNYIYTKFTLNKSLTKSSTISRSNISYDSQLFLENIKNNNKKRIEKLKQENNLFQILPCELLENSVTLTADSINSNLYHLEFQFSSNNNVLVKIFVNCSLNNNEFYSDYKNYIQLETNSFENEDLLNINNNFNYFKFYKGNNIKFSKGNFVIDIEQIGESFFEYNNNKNIYPLVIEFVPHYNDNDNITKYGFIYPKIEKVFYIIGFNSKFESEIYFFGIVVKNNIYRIETKNYNKILSLKTF